MAEPYAKIVVKETDDSFPWWDVILESDLREIPVELYDSSSYADCAGRAEEWSQRLRGIPVEEETK